MEDVINYWEIDTGSWITVDYQHHVYIEDYEPGTWMNSSVEIYANPDDARFDDIEVSYWYFFCGMALFRVC